MRLLIIGFLLLSLPLQLTSICGLPLEFYGYQFLNPEIARLDARFLPYLGGFEKIYQKMGALDQGVIQQKDNIDEWYERYCENVTKVDLANIIYGKSENRLKQLQAALANPNSRLGDLRANLRTNSFVRYLMKHRCAEVVDYLLYAKKVEPYVTNRPLGVNKPATNDAAMKALIKEGLAVFPSVKSHYLRLRYAYQLMRLSHYRGDYDHVLELHDYLMPKIDADASLIDHWIMGHYAGALQYLGRRVEAAYKFSRIFIECPSKRSSAYRSFSIQTDEEWEALLNLCESDRERADLYILRAQNPRAKLIPEMEEIYALDPTNAGLEMLLVREMSILEKEFLADDFNPSKRSNRRYGWLRPDAKDRLINTQQFVRKLIREEKVSRPAFWKVALGYLDLLAGDLTGARLAFWDVNPEVDNDTLKQQLNIFQRVLDIMAITELNDSLENAYFSTLKDDALLARYPDLDNLIYDKFRDTYRDNGEEGKAFLLTHQVEDLRYNLNIDLLQEFYTLAADTNDNSFEKRLLLERSGPRVMNDLIDMEATYYLQQGQLKLANQLFRQIPQENWDDYGNFAPFIARFKDRVNLSVADSSTFYNKAQLFQKLIDWEDEAALAMDPEIAAKRYFGIGLAYYNMSYFSYNWKAADYFRSGNSAIRAANEPRRNYVFSTYDYNGGNFENMNMEKARYYFEQSRRKTNDLELGARAAYWAAKAERNQYYADGKPEGRRPFTYFGLLADYYQNTNYYQKIVEQCRTFAWFVGK